MALSILLELVGNVATQYVVPKVRDYLRRLGKEKKADAIRTFLQDIGCHSGAEIRDLVHTWSERMGRELDPAHEEEIVGVLTNLANRARFLTTEGETRSSYVRCERLIDQLISNIAPHFRRGDGILGQEWRLERFLGMGSFGEVWMGANPLHPNARAYKFFTSPEGKDWIRREQQNLFLIKQKLDGQDHIVDFIDVNVHAEHPYLVLEYLEGGSLEDWILEDRERRSKLDKDEVVRGIASGLAEAHRHQIFHRDLKPANVLLTRDHDPSPKITDFGLAIATESTPSSASVLMTHAAIVGTYMYLPPESQNPAAERDPAKDDVFAFGVLWYQLLTERLERPPYDFPEHLRSQRVDSHTIALVSRCLAHPRRRFRDASELLESLGDSVPAGWEAGDHYDIQHLAREYLIGRRK